MNGLILSVRSAVPDRISKPKLRVLRGSTVILSPGRAIGALLLGFCAMVTPIGADAQAVWGDEAVSLDPRPGPLLPVTVVPRSSDADIFGEAPARSPIPNAEEDPHQKRSGLALTEVFFVNGVIWAFDRVALSAEYARPTPATMWHNLRTGFVWDDDSFRTNMIGHAYHGSLFFNAARTNGMTFLESVPFTIVGSYLWECCAEQEQKSWNDMIMTGLAGTTVGEALYQVTTGIVGEAAESQGMFGEIATFLLNPVRGLNRHTVGETWHRRGERDRASRVEIRPFRRNTMRVGMRSLQGGDPYDAVSDGAPFVELDLSFGEAFATEERTPFDYLTLAVRLDGMTSLGLIEIQGHLASVGLKNSESARHVFAVTQNYDMLSHDHFKFGGHSMGAAVLSDWRLSGAWSLDTHFELDGYLLSTVDSEFAFLAEIEDVNRLRQYDFGMGAGARVGIRVRRSGREILGAHYIGSWINTLNGSNAGGYASDHIVHLLRANTAIPITASWALGVDFSLQASHSFYAAPDRPNSSRQLPYAQISLIRNFN